MRKLSCILPVFLMIFLLFPLVSCKKKEAPQEKAGRVTATKAYQKYFGPAPSSGKGTCFAFVIYFPYGKEPGKVAPFPFFTFDEASMKKVAVERLIVGMNLPAYRNEILQPFADGAHLLELSQLEGLVQVNLSKDFLVSGKHKAGMLNALVMTLTQFEGVKGVRLLSEGKDIEFAKGTLLPDASSVLDPQPPRLLSVTAVKDKGAKDVEEVSAYFDRPVDIKVVRFADKDGNPFAGEVYQSVFDMAAVLKPKDLAQFKAGMPVKVRWKVVDKLGRMAEGESEFSLEVKEH